MLIGIGIGIIIGTFFMFGYKFERSISREKIEEKARTFGMDYPEEFKVINKKDVK
ncbi:MULTISPECIES: hypothetical protein [Clostridium]|uniref:hypothetical protein n=1 Tax=Clostridium TaxID=1485 RepID=UPI00164D7411|nr:MULTISPECIES: hypothetical protein [Clostridium]